MDQAAMTQLLADRLGITPAGNGLEMSDVAAAVASRNSNPVMAALMAQMLNRPPAEETEEPEDPRDEEIALLQRRVARLKQELVAANQMARYIADVFGTCSRCWGLNRLCPECGGRGQPGYAQPDLAELRAWVEPALHKGGLRITTQNQVRQT